MSSEVSLSKEDLIPDVRDGLTRLERVILHQLDILRQEGRGQVKTAELYGRVVEVVDVGESEFQAALRRLGVATP